MLNGCSKLALYAKSSLFKKEERRVRFSVQRKKGLGVYGVQWAIRGQLGTETLARCVPPPEGTFFALRNANMINWRAVFLDVSVLFLLTLICICKIIINIECHIETTTMP